ncbi:PREDICTED: uncharacterized protein LOC109587728 [Amphimedon queenslandica]|uniref:Death domain-containing protein n=2 Tax=Amphimedon queenslandica TaxID=400682 RepID=A0AAN0JRM9_AMPQE|nr:PREDICTED: uncharacterized protein LOC109587728 [Amphimedon queenslandica]|eukprot:XP_019859508.1 PREDICTED: uncharacterized protein LOC109587728 [Amphimedon queenslandica]
MATPFQPLLGIRDLAEILDLLERHRYSGVSYMSYKRLGLSLGLNRSTLESIESNYRGDVSRCLTECLVAWLRREGSVGVPTYDTLIKALRDEGEYAVADGIDRENIDVLKINDEVQETLTDTLLDIRDLAIVLQELTSNQQFDYANWKFLGLYLGLYQPTLKAIEINCRGQVKDCLIECISFWLKGEDGVRDTRGGGSNWISLVAALDVMGEREVANNIRMKYHLPG